MKLKIHNQPQAKISEDMYGLFFEDINYSLDGGLHAEMLENRNFEAVHACGCKDNYIILPNNKFGWNVYENNGDGSALYIDSEGALNQVNPHFLVFHGMSAGASFTNKAYDGLYIKNGMTYYISFYAKAIFSSADVKISVRKNGITYAEEAVVLENSEKWKKYTCMLKCNVDLKQADFVVSLSEKSTIAFDYFSMIPSDSIKGVFRKDMVDMLAALKPSFIRFPGGCVVEGNTLDNRYKWKESIGKIEERKFNWNRWAVHNAGDPKISSGYYADYGQSLGVGFYEYFLLCEYLKAKPLPVLSVGLACQYMSTEQVATDSEEMEEFIQDALDLIEFANGNEDTIWGRKRAEMGHPDPFYLEYIGIGNEQWQTEESDFFRRAKMFENRIHEKYPTIKIIGTAGPDVNTERYKDAWEFYRNEMKVNPNFVYAVDEHYYVKPEWLYENIHFYDEYDRHVKVFAGEYACHIPGLAGRMNCPEANSLGAALAEAAFLTGIERNADVVIMTCYAPLFARLGYTQWSPNLIWFNGEKAYGTPSYYVQQMYSCNRGSETLKTEWNIDDERRESVYFSAVRDENGDIIIKAVNVSDVDKKFEIELDGYSVKRKALLTEICGNLFSCNSISEPEKVKPKTYESDMDVTLKANSFTVVRFAE